MWHAHVSSSRRFLVVSLHSVWSGICSILWVVGDQEHPRSWASSQTKVCVLSYYNIMARKATLRRVKIRKERVILSRNLSPTPPFKQGSSAMTKTKAGSFSLMVWGGPFTSRAAWVARWASGPPGSSGQTPAGSPCRPRWCPCAAKIGGRFKQVYANSRQGGAARIVPL